MHAANEIYLLDPRNPRDGGSISVYTSSQKRLRDMRAPQGVLPELTSFTPARLIGQTEHMATPTQGGASSLSPETRSGRKPPEPRSYYQAPEPNAGESSSARIKTQPFRETLTRRESKQCCFSASPQHRFLFCLSCGCRFSCLFIWKLFPSQV